MLWLHGRWPYFSWFLLVIWLKSLVLTVFQVITVIYQETVDSKHGLQQCHEIVEDLLACLLAWGGPVEPVHEH